MILKNRIYAEPLQCHLFSKKQLVEKNNLGLKPCMKLPFKIRGVGFVIFIFGGYWERAVWWQVKENRSVELECMHYSHVEKPCREDLLSSKLYLKSQWHWEGPMYCFKSAHADDCSKVSAHHQKVVSSENVCTTSQKQVKPKFSSWAQFCGEWYGFLTHSDPPSLAVRGGSAAQGMPTPSLSAATKLHPEPSPLGTGAKSHWAFAVPRGQHCFFWPH